jgi:hypothetical protein
VVRPRVGDELTEVLVQIAADEQDDLRGRAILPLTLRLPISVAGSIPSSSFFAWAKPLLR